MAFYKSQNKVKKIQKCVRKTGNIIYIDDDM